MTLYEFAKVLRSKNSGPFQQTIDILFDDIEKYKRIKDMGLINKGLIGDLYGIKDKKNIMIVYYDQGLGIKVTFDRVVSSGTMGDRDVYGSQQYAPLMSLEVPDY